MPGDRASLVARLAAGIDRTIERSVARQLEELLWTEIIDGTLEPGARLPTERALAVGLGEHPRVVERALASLERRGVVRSEPGGVFVCLREAEPAALERARDLEELCAEFVARAEGLGFGLDDVLDELATRRLDSRERS